MKKDNIPGLEGYYISRFRYESREKICRLANEFKVSRLTIRRIVNPSLRSFNRLV